MNIEQKSTLFILSLILVVLLSVSSIALFLLSGHVKNEAIEGLDAAFANKQAILRVESRELVRNSRYLAAQLFDVINSKRSSRNKIEKILGQSRTISSNDLLLLNLRQGGVVDTLGSASHAVFISQRILATEEYEKAFKHVYESKKEVTTYLFIDDKVLNAVVMPVWSSDGKVVAVLLQGNVISNDDLRMSYDNYQKKFEVMLYKPNAVFSNTLPAFAYQAEIVPQNLSRDDLRIIEVGQQQYYSKSYTLMDSLYKAPRLYMMLSTSVTEEKRAYNEMIINAFYAGLIVMLLAALIGVQISRAYLSKPLKYLASVMHHIGDGDLNINVRHQARKDELGELAVSFEQMRSKIYNAQQQEALVKKRISDFAEISSDWLWETDADGVFTYLSSTVSESLGYSVEQLRGKQMSEIFIQDNLSEISMLFSAEVASHVGFKNLEIWLTTRQGYRICLNFNASPYFVDGEFQGYRGTASDITKSKNDEERLVRLANKDHLTGLSNRTRFMEELDREILLAERQYTKGALLLIDLDHFKLINDTAGHAAGDEVIVQFAGLLRRMARNVDLVARLSGDEFVIAFVNTDVDQLGKRIDEIVKKISQLKPMYSGKVMNTTASIGVAVFPDHSTDAVDLLAKADTAMYMAKSEGRNRSRMYEPGEMQQEKMGSQLIWKDRIHNALESEQFVLAYQPIQPTTGESPSRYEVLIRMRASDEGKQYYPGDFIPTAEQFGLIREIDNWVVKKAIGVLSGLPDDHAHISFTVNLSGLSVGEPDMYNLIESELARTGLDRNRVIFEVTESAAFQDIGRAIEFIDRIKALGCRIALDDFGVGFSSFSYLKQLQADILKIDGSFIRDIDKSKHDQLFVKALVDVARGMGMMTVAEFVETQEVYDVVRGLGVDYVQGYFVGKPTVNKFS